MGRDSSRSCGRRTNLAILYAIDIAVVVFIYLATDKAYGTGHFSIFKGTITLEDSYKIVGISGGPIAGPINEKREFYLLLHRIAMAELAAVSTIHTIAEFVEYYRRKKYGDANFESSVWANVFGVLYFVGWLYALGISAVGFVICAIDYSHQYLHTDNDFKGVSVSPKEGAQFAAVACALLLIGGLWRIIARGTHQNGTAKSGAHEADEKAVRINM